MHSIMLNILMMHTYIFIYAAEIFVQIEIFVQRYNFKKPKNVFFENF